MNHTASVETLLSPIMAPGLQAAPHTHPKFRVPRIPESVKCLPTILLSLLAGALGMSAFFGIVLPMLLSVPAIGSQLGLSGADAAYPLQVSRDNFAPITNALSTATGVTLKREDFNRPPALTQQVSFRLQLASQPVETVTR